MGLPPCQLNVIVKEPHKLALSSDFLLSHPNPNIFILIQKAKMFLKVLFMYSFIHNFATLFLIIAFISLIVKLAKQPIIIAYIISGFLASLIISKDVAGDQIMPMAELGITFLLFLMGLEFNLNNLKYIGRDIFIISTIQSITFFSIAFASSMLLGFSVTESTYLAILFMFSSTLLVAKWIEDRKETSSLYGKITLGILVVQDLFAIIILNLSIESGGVREGINRQNNCLRCGCSPQTGRESLSLATPPPLPGLATMKLPSVGQKGK